MPRMPMFVALALLAPAAPAAGQGLDFVISRFATHSAHAVYAGYDAGPALVFVGVLQNPRSAYRQAMAGVGRAVHLGRVHLLTGMAAATTSDGDFAQVYLLPNVTVGPVELDVTIGGQQQLGGSARHLFVAPADVLVALRPGLALGGTWVMDASNGARTSHGAGPTAAVRIRGGRLLVHWLWGLRDRPDELWLRASVRP